MSVPKPRLHIQGARSVTYAQRRRFRVRLVEYPQDVTRPITRGDCLNGGSNAQRPCPFVSCRWHLAIDISYKGALKINFPDREVDELAETCALDVADRGGELLEVVATYMNLTRERVRQVKDRAIAQLPQDGPLGEWRKRP